MAVLNFSTITIPTPQPYDRSTSTQNNENFYYVMLQILNLLKTSSFKIADKDETNTAQILALQDLIYNGATLDLGPLKITFTGKQITVLTT